jgi:peptide deformylase
MALRNVVLYPHPALTTPAEPVTEFDERLHAFIEDMAETMYHSRGVGLAANQIAVLKRVALVDVAEDGEPAQRIELINPSVVAASGKGRREEGCLSFPKLYDNIDRATEVTVQFVNRFNEPQQVTATGLLAVALQHEIDHLDGKVFLDRMGPLQRAMALKRYRKLMERRAENAAAAAGEKRIEGPQNRQHPRNG